MMKWNIFSRLTVASAMSICAIAALAQESDTAVTSAVTQPTETNVFAEKITGHSVFAGGGIGQIMSEFDAYWASGDPQFAGMWQVGYEWVSKKRFGTGFLYNGYYTKGSFLYYDTFKESICIHYLAPQFVGRVAFGKGRWLFGYGAGVGLVVLVDRLRYREDNYVSYREVGKNTDYGFGVNMYLGAEYRLTTTWGIFGRLSYTEALLKQEFMGQEMHRDDGNVNGFSRIELSVGVRYNFQ